MIILSLKTDNPISEIALFDNYSLIDSVDWEAHRSLADTIHHKILNLLEHSNYLQRPRQFYRLKDWDERR